MYNDEGGGGGAELSCPLHAPHNNFKVSKLESRLSQQFHYLRSPYCRQWEECDMLVLVSLVHSAVVVDVTSRSSTITLLQTLQFFFHPFFTSRNRCFFFLTCFKCFTMFLNSVCFRLFRKLFSSKDSLLNPNVGTVRSKLCKP